MRLYTRRQATWSIENVDTITIEVEMPHVITLEGLPEPVAKALIETVNNLKNSYRIPTVDPTLSNKTVEGAEQEWDEFLDTLPVMPSLSDEALRRESMYARETDPE